MDVQLLSIRLGGFSRRQDTHQTFVAEFIDLDHTTCAGAFGTLDLSQTLTQPRDGRTGRNLFRLGLDEIMYALKHYLNFRQIFHYLPLETIVLCTVENKNHNFCDCFVAELFIKLR